MPMKIPSSKGKSWIEQRKILLLEIRELIKKHVPCSSDKLVAHIELETGLSKEKAQEALGIFFHTEFICIESRGREKVVVLKESK